MGRHAGACIWRVQLSGELLGQTTGPLAGEVFDSPKMGFLPEGFVIYDLFFGINQDPTIFHPSGGSRAQLWLVELIRLNSLRGGGGRHLRSRRSIVVTEGPRSSPGVGLWLWILRCPRWGLSLQKLIEPGIGGEWRPAQALSASPLGSGCPSHPGCELARAKALPAFWEVSAASRCSTDGGLRWKTRGSAHLAVSHASLGWPSIEEWQVALPNPVAIISLLDIAHTLAPETSTPSTAGHIIILCAYQITIELSSPRQKCLPTSKACRHWAMIAAVGFRAALTGYHIG